VRFAAAAYGAGAVLLLFTEWPGPLAAVLPLAYVFNVLPYWSVPDSDAERANRAWRRFLWLNFATGFVVTMLLIWYLVAGVGQA
jgi:hypothetical protein